MQFCNCNEELLFPFSRTPTLYDDDNLPTGTSEEQRRVENSTMKFFAPYKRTTTPIEKMQWLSLWKKQHTEYLLRGLDFLSAGYESLDASRPWICYWILHSLDLLGAIDDDFLNRYEQRVIDFLGRCAHPVYGGYGGGPGQLPHLAPTYAAVNALAILGTERAFASIDRDRILQFYRSMKYAPPAANNHAAADSGPNRRRDDASGGFRMHRDGEVDIRGAYTVMAVATLLGIGGDPVLRDGLSEYLAACQTYEGGLAAYPGNEAHGGYAFCGLAALMLLHAPMQRLNVQSLIEWCVARQMSYEGGFQGRTNKLVDSCYSFWLGGTFPLIQALLSALTPSEQRTDFDRAVFRFVSWRPNDSDSDADWEQWRHLAVDHDLYKSLLQSAAANRRQSSAVHVELEDPVDSGLDVHASDDSGEYEDISDEESQSESGDVDLPQQTPPQTSAAGGEMDTSALISTGGEWLLDEIALQEYILLCCQLPDGGLRDKPSKSRDYYHTCYALSGLSIAQHNPTASTLSTLSGSEDHTLRVTSPLFNICSDKVQRILRYFGNRNTDSDDGFIYI